MKQPIYLDYAATTPMDPRVAEKLKQCLTMGGNFGNPASSSHIYGQRAKASVEAAREQVASLINADSNEIIWTSGATESNNLAIKGVADFYQDKGKHIITLKTEHKAVLDPCKYLQDHGYDVTYLPPESNGLLDIETLKQALREDTILVSIMHVNNEIGVIQDIQAIAEVCRQHNILFHSDCAQSAGKVDIDVKAMPVDLLSFSAHKIYGPKGMGALYIRRKPRARLNASIHGGGHEQGMRSGTLAAELIVAMGEAFAIAKAEMSDEIHLQKQLRDKLWQSIKDIDGVTLNGDFEQRVATNLNVSVAGVEGGALLMALQDLAISTGSACTSATIEPSYVLRALGVADTLAHSSLRITVGRFTTAEDIEYAAKQLQDGIAWLRAMAPTDSDIA